MSFRLKTILSIALLGAILLLVLIFSMINFLNQSNQTQLQQRADSTSHLFAHTVKDALLSTDLASLESFIQEIINMPDMVYARISNNQFILAEGGDISLLNALSTSAAEDSAIAGSMIATRVEIKEAGRVYGVIELGMSTASVLSLLSDARNWIIVIACIELALIVIFSYALGTYLTRQLQRLKIASESIIQRGPGVQIKVRGCDELAQMARAFNRMSSSLAQNYKQLRNSIETERRMTALAESNQAKNNAILNASLDALITIDERGCVLDYNKVAEKTFGWTASEILGNNLAHFIIPAEQRAAHHKGMKKYLETRKGPVLNKRIELTAQHKAGHSFPIEINIAPIETEQGPLFTAFIRDISARQQAETELRLAAQTFESSEAIFICDINGAIIRTNRAFSRITGYEHAEVVGKNPSILSSGQHSAEYYQALWLSLIVHGQWSGEIYNKRKNGEIYPEYLNISSARNSAGAITHYIAHFIDISEQKRNEENLRAAQREAEKSNESKSRFLAAMSHEIRTPMNAVLGILGLLKDSELSDRQLELVQTGRDSGELLLTIINDILDFTKMDIDKLQLEHSVFDLHLLLSSCNQLLSNLAQKKSLRLTLTLAKELPQFVKGDPERIRQILINLINNAIKFTRQGSVEVSASVAAIDEEVFTLSCRVKDTGIGIPQAHQGCLFDEFTMVDQTHSRKYEGTGLGLAICKRLVSLMHGEISVNSEPGKGSAFTFSIELQRAQENDSEKLLTAQQTELMPLPGTRILLAEDNPANQMVIKSILELAKLQVDVVANGCEALEVLQARPYDIVLMDISMPEMDGMTATRAIRKLRGAVSKIPVIALTAHHLNGDKERFIAAGMNDYLSKPIDRSATLSCIARWSETRETAVENPHDDGTATEENTRDSDGDFVDEAILQQLVRDTSADIVPELIAMYIEDSQSRVTLIAKALAKQDVNSLEFEAHTLGSSAIAHGNDKLHKLMRSVEQLCRQNHEQQAFAQAKQIANIAEASFRLLAQRAEQGFD